MPDQNDTPQGGAPQQPPQPPYPYHAYRRRSSNWWIPVAVIGGVFLLLIIGLVAFLGAMGSMVKSSFKQETYEVEAKSVLYLDFKDVAEIPETNPFDFGSGGAKASYSAILSALKSARNDDNIEGVYIEGKPTASIGFSKASEIQEELLDFKKSGKFIYAYSEGCNESIYFNMLVADSIFMPLEGVSEMNGFGVSPLFMTGLFEKIGLNFTVIGFEDFKSAGETVSREKFSDSARYQYRVFLNQRHAKFVEAVSKLRKIDKSIVEEVLSKGVYTPKELMEYKFIDAYAFESDVKEMIKKKVYGDGEEEKDKKLKLVSIHEYVHSAPPPAGEIVDENKKIAIIRAVGPIVSQSADSPFGDEMQIVSKKYVKYLKEAREDEDVKAIILRIDSPGGSVAASDEIRREIIKTRKVKPVFASMSDVAASGGYYIAMDCDTIIAHPTTLTGSIGVIMSIPNVSSMKNKLALSVDTISTTPSAQFMNGAFPFTEKDKEVLRELGEGFYTRFLEKVSKARGKSYEETRALAKGRVWTGEDAQKRGLVDVLGGFDKAISIAKASMDIPDSSLVFVDIYPKPKDPIEELLEMFGLDNSGDSKSQLKAIASRLGMESSALAALFDELPESVRSQILYSLNIARISQKEKFLYALPSEIIVE